VAQHTPRGKDEQHRGLIKERFGETADDGPRARQELVAESLRQRRALIIDDEQKIVEVLSSYLTDEGFAVTGAFDGVEAMRRALSETYDVILLDLNLPTISGVEILKAVRKVSNVPIVMVTARDDVIDRVVGLELGADDYICKPFNPREVMARVKTLSIASSGDCRTCGSSTISSRHRCRQGTDDTHWLL